MIGMRKATKMLHSVHSHRCTCHVYVIPPCESGASPNWMLACEPANTVQASPVVPFHSMFVKTRQRQEAHSSVREEKAALPSVMLQAQLEPT